jgi:biotin carboxyl carrier protein
VEFLVVPETGEHFFIECNPRIQVEHTVTEQVTGIDLVEAQLQIAAGVSLASLGLGDPHSVAVRGFAVQARVVATGTGVLTAYKEPTGPGVRVDACGYLGYAPPPQFDPLLAKVIGSSTGARSFASAIDRTLRALDEFHVGGLPSNLALLRAILSHPSVRAGDARTSLLEEAPEILRRATSSTREDGGPLSLLERKATAPAPVASPSPLRELDVPDGQRGVECPLQGSIVEIRAMEGTRVAAGDTLLIVSAMKMETAVQAPCSGVVTAVLPLRVGDSVAPGQVVAAIAPTEVGVGARTAQTLEREETWTSTLEEIETLRRLARERLAPGSEDPGVVRQRSRGKLTCRERIALLLDDGSFREVGSVAGFASYDETGAIRDFTPANHVGGWGKIDGRTVVVCADDFTSREGHSDGAIGAKSAHLDRLSFELRIPSVRMLDGSSGGGSVAAMVPKQRGEGESRARESSGAIQAGQPRVVGGGGSFLPGHLGSTMFTEQLSTVPVLNLLLGSVVGIGAAKAVLGPFSVMVRDIAQLFVAGPPVVRHAMGYDITKEDLGGWHIHCRNGSVDNLAESEEEAAAQARRFLFYLRASTRRLPCGRPTRATRPTGARRSSSR